MTLEQIFTILIGFAFIFGAIGIWVMILQLNKIKKILENK